MLFYTKTAKETLEYLNSSTEGISSYEAKKRLKSYGKNEITTKGTPLWKKIIKPFTDVFAFVLFVAVIVSFIQQSYLDAFLIIIIILMNSTIYYIQSFSNVSVSKSGNVIHSITCHSGHLFYLDNLKNLIFIFGSNARKYQGLSNFLFKFCSV